MDVAKKGVPKKLNIKGRVLGGEGLRVLLLEELVGVRRVEGRERVHRKPAAGAGAGASPCVDV